jgi:hypothetical protein
MPTQPYKERMMMLEKQSQQDSDLIKTAGRCKNRIHYPPPMKKQLYVISTVLSWNSKQSYRKHQ